MGVLHFDVQLAFDYIDKILYFIIIYLIFSLVPEKIIVRI